MSASVSASKDNETLLEIEIAGEGKC
jgi:hypothetical protein